MIKIALWTLILPGLALASSDGEAGHTVISNIATCMVGAGLLGLLMKVLKQPLILGYLITGFVIGPYGLGIIADHIEVITIAEIGLILLLFMIGLEIDLKKMLSAGKNGHRPGTGSISSYSCDRLLHFQISKHFRFNEY